MKPCAIRRGRGNYCSKICQAKAQEITMIGDSNPNYRHGRTYEKGFYKETVRKWREKNKKIVYMNARRQRALRRNAEGSFKTSEIRELISKQKSKCASCYQSIDGKYHVDHIMPIKLGGSNYIDNIQILCPTCNMKKGSKHPIDWANENGRLL